MNDGEGPRLRVIAVGVLRAVDHVLVGRRVGADHLPGFDEFPGGHLEAGETLERCVEREFEEETGLAVEVLHRLAREEHRDERRALELHFFACRLVEECHRDQALTDPHLRWVPIEELASLSFPPANQRVLGTLVRELQSATRW